MNWKCKIGLHDWLYYESESYWKIYNRVKGDSICYSNEGLPYYSRKVCQREGCCKKVDEITELEIQIQKEIEEKKRKRKLTEKLWKEC